MIAGIDSYSDRLKTNYAYYWDSGGMVFSSVAVLFGYPLFSYFLISASAPGLVKISAAALGVIGLLIYNGYKTTPLDAPIVTGYQLALSTRAVFCTIWNAISGTVAAVLKLFLIVFACLTAAEVATRTTGSKGAGIFAGYGAWRAYRYISKKDTVSEEKEYVGRDVFTGFLLDGLVVLSILVYMYGFSVTDKPTSMTANQTAIGQQMEATVRPVQPDATIESSDTTVQPSEAVEAPEPIPQTDATDETLEGITVPYVTITNVGVRKGPGNEFKTVAQIPAGTRINVTGTEGGWLRVISKHGNPPGYIHASLAHPVVQSPNEQQQSLGTRPSPRINAPENHFE